MDLQRLNEMGGFVPQVPVAREVSWTRPGPDGEDVTDTFNVRVLKLSAGDVERLWADVGRQMSQSYAATLISKTILLGDDGDTQLSYEDAFRMDPSLAETLLEDAVYPVNPLNRRKGTTPKN